MRFCLLDRNGRNRGRWIKNFASRYCDIGATRKVEEGLYRSAKIFHNTYPEF